MKRFFKCFTWVGVLFFGIGQLLMAQPADPNLPLKNDESVRYGKLPNGLTYYIQHNAKPEQRAEFYFVADVGAIQETPAQDGLAHFLEHMALNGSKNLPGKMMLDYFRTIGVEFGRNINAGTGVEQTSYMFNNIPVHRQGIIDTAMLALHDYCAFVTNDFEEINKERGIIVEEWRTRRSADWRMHEQELNYLYKDSKYATCTLIGSKENLETFNPQELVDFYEKWYRPDLQAVIIVGDIDVDAIEAQIKEMFADLPVPTTPNPKVLYPVPGNEEPIVAILTDPEARNTQATIYFKSEPLPKEFNNLGAAYLNSLVEYIISSVLNERLSEISQQPDAPFLGGGAGFGAICNTCDAFLGRISTRDGEILPGFEALMVEFEKMRRFGMTDAEVERAKTNLINYLDRARQRAEGRTNAELVDPLMNHFLSNEPYMTPEYEYEVASGYSQMLNAMVLNQVVAQMDLEHNAVIIYNAPQREGLVHPTEADFVAVMEKVRNSEITANEEQDIPTEFMNADGLKGSKVKKTQDGIFGTTVWTLKNGIKVYLKHTDFNKQQVMFNLSTPGGRSLIETADLANFEGNIYSTIIGSAGVYDFNVNVLGKMMTGKSVNVHASIGNYTQNLSGSFAPQDMEDAFQMLYLMATEPRFEESEIQSGLNQLASILPNLLGQPNFVYQREQIDALYGGNERRQFISEEMLSQVDLKRMKEVYSYLFSNFKGAELVIVGNFDEAALKPMVEKYIGSLPVARKPFSVIERNDSFVRGTVERHFTTPMTTPKTTVGFILSADMPYTLKNELTISAMNYILDVLYTETIREEEGGTYGVQAFGYLNPKPEPMALLQIQFDTNEEKAQILAQMAKDGLRSIAENGVTAAELSKATENMLKNIPEERINNHYWFNLITTYLNHDADMDSNKEEIIKSITPEDVQAMAAALLNSGNFIEVIMNPAK